jgi:predicted metal-dependent hydrolase
MPARNPVPPSSLPSFRLVRSRRKSVALVVEADGSLTVRAPLRLARKQIESLVAEKQAWVRQKQAEALTRQPAVHQYAAGEEFWLLGRRYPLRLSSQGNGLRFTGSEFVLSWGQAADVSRRDAMATPLRRDAIATLFTDWYRQQARQHLAERASLLAARHGFRFQRLGITSARTRWGSCSARGSLSFTWRLVMAPLEIIDYVVVHELCHLAHHNHGPEFWAAVAAILPDWAARRAWLKKNGGQFNLG